jgi:hypothetical protein
MGVWLTLAFNFDKFHKLDVINFPVPMLHDTQSMRKLSYKFEISDA